ncbi:uncharacterized protein LOC141914152 [Tubulanus polymorphus]|uniref:uncharacterized protein LOC141914152 n=1 Tax=Tubulanus polymorphus TaxID=672921 RepID=UPI003DA581B6
MTSSKVELLLDGDDVKKILQSETSKAAVELLQKRTASLNAEEYDTVRNFLLFVVTALGASRPSLAVGITSSTINDAKEDADSTYTIKVLPHKTTAKYGAGLIHLESVPFAFLRSFAKRYAKEPDKKIWRNYEGGLLPSDYLNRPLQQYVKSTIGKRQVTPAIRKSIMTAMADKNPELRKQLAHYMLHSEKTAYSFCNLKDGHKGTIDLETGVLKNKARIESEAGTSAPGRHRHRCRHQRCRSQPTEDVKRDQPTEDVERGQPTEDVEHDSSDGEQNVTASSSTTDVSVCVRKRTRYTTDEVKAIRAAFKTYLPAWKIMLVAEKIKDIQRIVKKMFTKFLFLALILFIVIGAIEGYKFAGLQAGWQCFCGNRVGKYGPAPESECSGHIEDGRLWISGDIRLLEKSYSDDKATSVYDGVYGDDSHPGQFG